MIRTDAPDLDSLSVKPLRRARVFMPMDPSLYHPMMAVGVEPLHALLAKE